MLAILDNLAVCHLNVLGQLLVLMGHEYRVALLSFKLLFETLVVMLNAAQLLLNDGVLLDAGCNLHLEVFEGLGSDLRGLVRRGEA